MKQRIFRAENLVYAALWLLLALTPVIAAWSQLLVHDAATFEWREVWAVWQRMWPFALLFVIHNWLLAPLLLRRQKRSYYFFSVTALVIVFAVYQCTQRPARPRPFDAADRPPMSEQLDAPPARPPMHELRDGAPGKRPGPPLLFGQHDIGAVIILILMFGMNLGVKYYFRHLEEEQRDKERERERIRQQLAYLQYQVNPHFLMNTLNNIHALIDIQPEQAQNAIVELSRLMRYTLYEGDHQAVPLAREVEFLGHYIALMQIRYTDPVDIRFDVPSPLPAATVPPLLYATFVENAFKHGVSYQHASFVHVSFSAQDGRLLFTCVNSRHPVAAEAAGEGGLGLRNVRQRLDLLFPGDYTLDITESPTTFTVHLNTPCFAS